MERHTLPTETSPLKTNANFMLSPEITGRISLAVEQLWGNPKYDYLRTELMSKFVSSETDPADVRRKRALDKWLVQEKINFFTNLKLRKGFADDYHIIPRVQSKTFFDFCRKTVAYIIGCQPPLTALTGGFSGGATTSRKRADGHPALKYIGKADITAAAKPYWDIVFAQFPTWSELSSTYSLRLVEGNEFFTVPKKTDIDRACCKEPDINMYLQKGVGNHIRRALKRFRIDLDDQTRNQRLAQIGSRDGSLATLDLSSASDSVTLGLVEMLFPPEWTIVLKDLRSPITRYKKRATDRSYETHVNEMLSSMGNGFTFEVESLIFYVLARAVAYFRGERFSSLTVYGDDIICPSTMYDDLVWVLTEVGFTVNSEKSFSKGPFRESCGGHYYHGEDVTPFYLRKPVTHLTDLILLLNGIRRWSDDGTRVLDPVLEHFWFRHSVFVPKSLWGGRDYGSSEQLVSPGLPRKRLVAVTQDREIDETGKYLLWLNTSMDRDNQVYQTIEHWDKCSRDTLIDVLGLLPTFADGLETSEVTEEVEKLLYCYGSVAFRHSIKLSGPEWMHELLPGYIPKVVVSDEPLLL